MHLTKIIRVSLLWLAGVAVASLSLSYSVGSVSKSRNPLIAVGTVPSNGFAYANASNVVLKAAIGDDGRQIPINFDPSAAVWAKKAFVLEPMSATAIRMLALDLVRRNETDQARKLMSLSIKLSKRDHIANLWLIEDYTKAQNAKQALFHYDLILRTSRPAREILLPELVIALENEQLIEPLEELLLKRPSWSFWFWRTLVRSQGPLVNGALLRARLHNAKIDILPEQDQVLIQKLVADNQFSAASQLRLALADGDPQYGQILYNGEFKTTPDGTPFDWLLAAEGQYSSVINSAKSELVASAIPDSNGIIAQQLIALEPQTYKLSVNLLGSRNSATELTINLQCADIEPGLKYQLTVPLSENETQIIADLSQAPCQYFWFRVNMAIPANGQDDYAVFDKISIVPEA